MLQFDTPFRERRRSFRVQTNACVFLVGPSGEIVEASVHNLSLGGALLRVEGLVAQRLRLHEGVAVSIGLYGPGGAASEIRCTIVSQRVEGLMGVHFKNLTAADEDLIEDLVLFAFERTHGPTRPTRDMQTLAL